MSRLSDLLNGKTVEVSGAKINVGVHKDGSLFCLDYLAKKLVVSKVNSVFLLLILGGSFSFKGHNRFLLTTNPRFRLLR